MIFRYQFLRAFILNLILVGDIAYIIHLAYAKMDCLDNEVDEMHTAQSIRKNCLLLETPLSSKVVLHLSLQTWVHLFLVFFPSPVINKMH